RRKAVTIGIGLMCRDGIVLCSDRQLTSSSGFKYDAKKIMKYTHADYELGFSYAGEEDSAKAMFRIITEEFDAELKNAQGKAPTERAHKALVEIYKNKTAKYLQTLVGICFKNTCFSLFRSSANLIVEGHTETIGSGDTSALRYLSDYLLREIP